MNAFVIDTNVAIVANERSPQAGPDCVLRCVEALESAREGVIVIDDAYRILDEYMNHLSFAGEPGAGDAFFKWLFENQAVEERCERVPLTLRSDDPDDFNEFPADPELAKFDPPDRKFVAVALASRLGPEILYAVDSDWWNHQEALERNGVKVRLVCPDQAVRFQQKRQRSKK